MINMKTLVLMAFLSCLVIWHVEGRSYFEWDDEEKKVGGEELENGIFGQRLFFPHDTFRKDGETMDLDEKLFFPPQTMALAYKQKFPGLRKILSKRNPKCLINCAKLNQIHPIQCHSLC